MVYHCNGSEIEADLANDDQLEVWHLALLLWLSSHQKAQTMDMSGLLKEV